VTATPPCLRWLAFGLRDKLAAITELVSAKD
jgi:hypothetical protein